MLKCKFICFDLYKERFKPVTCLDFSEWWVSTGFNDGERNSFRNERTDRHILLQATGYITEDGLDVCVGMEVLEIETNRIYTVVYSNYTIMLENEHGSVPLSNNDRLKILGFRYEDKLYPFNIRDLKEI